jgi:hypothetical protein
MDGVSIIAGVISDCPDHRHDGLGYAPARE